MPEKLMGDEQMLVGSIHLMGVDGTLTDDGIDPAGLPKLIKIDYILHGPMTAFTVALLHIDRAMILHDEYIRLPFSRINAFLWITGTPHKTGRALRKATLHKGGRECDTRSVHFRTVCREDVTGNFRMEQHALDPQDVQRQSMDPFQLFTAQYFEFSIEIGHIKLLFSMAAHKGNRTGMAGGYSRPLGKGCPAYVPAYSVSSCCLSCFIIFTMDMM